tara:strand:+ start:1454 stop:2314 length:861 start_codon:yes stop_codon:yes gene_type:complete
LSRNKDRLGMGDTTPDNSGPPPQVLQQETSGFSFVVPTEFVELPSRGRFYPENHPLHGQESIEVKQMTAKEEDILTSRTLLKKGVALDRVIQNLIMDPNINADNVLVGDRNAILIAIRASAYGNIYTTKVTCPACETAQEYSFDLNEANIYDGTDQQRELSIVDHQDGTFDTVLPSTQVTATFRLLIGSDEKTILKGTQNKQKSSYEKAVTTHLRNMIVGVNGDNSAQARNYLVENMPSVDARHLRMAYKAVAPNIDLNQEFSCGECGHEQEMEVPLTADFFWPDR